MDMNSPSAQFAQFIGRQAGQHLAGDAPLNVSAAQVRRLGNQVPRGAEVDVCANRLTFTTTTVSFVVEAVPANNPDMTFRIAGLVNPTVVVPRNAQAQPPFAFRPAAQPAFDGAWTRVIGDPTAAGQGGDVTRFSADTPGTYAYLCPMPGHAQMGMYGTFIVQ
jgi:hypothetical protein